jgi:hypothetical protein
MLRGDAGRVAGLSQGMGSIRRGLRAKLGNGAVTVAAYDSSYIQS